MALESAPSAGIWIWTQHQGGAISRVPPHATAYFNRGASHNFGFANIWQMPAEDADRNTDWVRKAWAQLYASGTSAAIGRLPMLPVTKKSPTGPGFRNVPVTYNDPVIPPDSVTARVADTDVSDP